MRCNVISMFIGTVFITTLMGGNCPDGVGSNTLTPLALCDQYFKNAVAVASTPDEKQAVEDMKSKVVDSCTQTVSTECKDNLKDVQVYFNCIGSAIQGTVDKTKINTCKTVFIDKVPGKCSSSLTK